MLALAGCGGGGGGGGSTVTNNPPTSNAGSDQSVDEQTGVTLDGTGSSDPEGDALSYAWTQTAGPTVTLSNATTAQATFASPNVGIGSTATLTFQLRVSARGGASNDTVTITVNGVSNSDPVVDAGNDMTVAETQTVGLVATASDDDIGDTLSYAWTQLTGTSVTISNADTASASFDAPNVGAGGEVLTFQVAVSDGTATITDTVAVTVQDAPPAVTISGKVFYQFVPPRADCRILDFANTETRFMRGVTVQLIEQATGNVLDTTTASEQGDYSFANIAPSTQVFLRVRAELKNSGALPNWDFEVRDNVDLSASPPPLPNRPLYVLDGAPFDSGVADQVRDLTAETGWTGSAYTGPRAAAPFAILDTVYETVQFGLQANPTPDYPPLDIFWSVNNTRVSGDTDIDGGEFGASFFTPDPERDGIANASYFLLGDASIDTEEFDAHITAHESIHFVDWALGRADSPGGRHVLGDRLDARLAWGEGWPTAYAAMALDDPNYCDTGSVTVANGFGIFAEDDTNYGTLGWFNEVSVIKAVYDMWDTNNDGTDTGSIPWQKIHDAVFVDGLDTPAYMTIFAFATLLDASLTSGEQTVMRNALAGENIGTSNLDVWGTNAGNPLGGRDVLPLYTDLTPGAGPLNICVNDDFDPHRDGNKLAEYRYVRLNVTQNRPHTITVTTTSVEPGGAPSQPDPSYDCVAAFNNDPDDPLVHTYSDPDFILSREGAYLGFGLSCTPNQETVTTGTLTPGTYLIDPNEYRFADEDTIAGYPNRVCFDITVTVN
ncbi:MAG: hypothetical protein QNJ07_07690 [Woeseiaceae bacterium]|nr:hypothetical protein [Woeseiaceae bacterium]